MLVSRSSRVSARPPLLSSSGSAREGTSKDWTLWVVGAALLLMAVASWMDTKARVGRIERKLNALLRHQGVDPNLGPPLSDRVKQLAADSARKIEAIKVYREETGAGLVEAKEAVEAYIHSR
jgi:hypothetical protein